MPVGGDKAGVDGVPIPKHLSRSSARQLDFMDIYEQLIKALRTEILQALSPPIPIPPRLIADEVAAIMEPVMVGAMSAVGIAVVMAIFMESMVL